MKKAVSAALMAGGLLLLYFGYHESRSFQSEIHQFLRGGPSDRALWMLIGGVAASIAGFAGLLRQKDTV